MLTDTWPAGYDRVVLDEVDSTMAEAARRAPGLTQPTWIMARRQTAAKGRRGRAWQSPAGNFAATLVVPNPGSALEAAQRSFVAALALDGLFQDHMDPARIALKWPNDVLIDGRKAAGILLEASGQGAVPTYLAVGIGINLVTAPAAETLEPQALPPIALAETGAHVSQDAALDGLATHFARFEQLWVTQGFDSLRASWLRRAAKLGEAITARTAQTEHRGIFDTIDETGNLVLLTPEGRQVIPAADVYF